MKTASKALVGLAAVGLAAVAAAPAHARDNFSINLDLGGPAYYNPGPPAYIVRPAPAYYGPPPPMTRVVYYQPAYYRPYYHGDRVVVRDRWGSPPGWHRGWQGRHW